MRILVFDIGNTQIKAGVYDDEKLVTTWRMMTASSRTTDEHGVQLLSLLQYAGIEIQSIDRVAVSSVVPGIMHSFIGAIRRYLEKEPLVIGPGVKTGVRVKTADPKQVGADLVCDVAATLEKYGAPALIVDFGTVTKYEVVNEKGEFVAAVFSPGIGISANAMSEKASLLPTIEIKKPAHVLSSETVECMQSGLVNGYIGQVRYLIGLIKEELNLPDLQVIATGGFGRIMYPEVPEITHFDAQLPLEGIRLIALKNPAPKRAREDHE